MADFAEIARGLLTLEVNTILKDGMSAQKMPTPTNALIDTMLAYHRFCVAATLPYGVPGTRMADWAEALSQTFPYGRQPFPALAAGPRAAPACCDAGLLRDEPLGLRRGDIARLREVALWLSHMRLRTLALHHGQAVEPVPELAQAVPGADAATVLHDHRVDPATLTQAQRNAIATAAAHLAEIDSGTLNRIRHNCDQLRGVRTEAGQGPELNDIELTRTTSMVLSTDALVLLRKTWDMGTEAVQMQTVIHIDGDVVTRLASALADRQRPGLHAAHQAAVEVSFRQWTWLVDTLARWAGRSVQALLGR